MVVSFRVERTNEVRVESTPGHCCTSASNFSRASEFFTIVVGSGTGDFKGLTGGGGIAIDPDGTHRIWFDCEFGP